jgi:hypothetical protein
VSTRECPGRVTRLGSWNELVSVPLVAVLVGVERSRYPECAEKPQSGSEVMGCQVVAIAHWTRSQEVWRLPMQDRQPCAPAAGRR